MHRATGGESEQANITGLAKRAAIRSPPGQHSGRYRHHDTIHSPGLPLGHERWAEELPRRASAASTIGASAWRMMTEIEGGDDIGATLCRPRYARHDMLDIIFFQRYMIANGARKSAIPVQPLRATITFLFIRQFSLRRARSRQTLLFRAAAASPHRPRTRATIRSLHHRMPLNTHFLTRCSLLLSS